MAIHYTNTCVLFSKSSLEGSLEFEGMKRQYQCEVPGSLFSAYTDFTPFLDSHFVTSFGQLLSKGIIFPLCFKTQ